MHVEPTSYRTDHADLTIAVPDEPATIEAMMNQLAELSGGRAAPGLGAVRWLDEA